MKRQPMILIVLGLAILTSPIYCNDDMGAEGSNEEEEEVGACGPVPNHGQMMAVLKPMSHIVVCAVNQIMDFGILLKDIQRVVERLCLTFDECVPSGKLANNKRTNPEITCIQNKCITELVKEYPTANQTIFDLVFNCILHPLLPLQKQHIWSVVHWILQMTNM